VLGPPETAGNPGYASGLLEPIRKIHLLARADI
jgi:hypothetical protein